jgi:hypothetical protein
MNLISLRLRNKRDAMVARQRARQLAGLLGYDNHDQAVIAAGVFAIAWQVLGLRSPVELSFDIENNLLRVFARSRRRPADEATSPSTSVLCLEKPVPERTRIGLDDLAWAIDCLDNITPAQMYEEIYRLNQELLATLHALQMAQNQLAMLKGEKTHAA